MYKVRNMLLPVAATLLISFNVFAQQGAGDSNFVIKKLEAQTVLYSIHRGPYEKLGESIGRLFALAGQKNILPKGPIALVYLNNPQNTTQEHILVEIRIPVDANALQRAGTLGPMTDIKKVNSSEYAIIKKPAGQTNYEDLYRGLYERITKEGYRRTDSAIEVFPQTNMTGQYNQMDSEIRVPVVKN